MEAKFLFDAAFAFFWSKLGDLDRIHDHGVRIVGFGVGGVREGVIGLVGRPRVSFGDVVGSLPLSLESDGLLVPFVDGGGDGVHGHDAAHERGWDSCGEVSDQDVGIGDIGEGDVVFEGGNIFRQRGGVRVVLLALLHCWVDSQEMALPVTSWCLNVVLNFVTKSVKVPRENIVPEMALWRKVAAQVRADPLVMYERAKAICLLSLS